MKIIAAVVALIIGLAILLDFDFNHIKGLAVAVIALAVALVVEGAMPLIRRGD